MKIHEREGLVRDAEANIKAAISRETARLTEAESLRVVSAACWEWVGTIAKYAIRDERHGNTDTPGGLAPQLPSNGNEP